MSTLVALRSSSTLHDVAALLDTTTKALIHTLYRVPEASRYKTFQIPKKGGGYRTIHAPVGKIKVYQRVLADILYQCDTEIQEVTKRRPLSHGFRLGQSIVTNANLHKNRRYVLNLDLADFFPSFNFGRVRGFFIKDKAFSLKPECATILAQIACYQGALPQGSPCSPIIADLIARILDQRLVRFAKQNHVTYSRYADDLTFSTNAKSFPAEIATGGSDPNDPWLISAPLITRIEGTGFLINPDKTRMQVAGARQLVTGLTVNDKVNIPQSYWRNVRSMCHALFQTGSYRRPGTDPNDAKSAMTSLRPLRGILGHVYHVKISSHIRPSGHPGEKTKPPMIFGQRLHEDFYFYDYFIALDRPLIITEGPSDPVYLRNAIRRLTRFHPSLGAFNGKNFIYKVGFFNYENTVHKLLRITGGSDILKNLAVQYRKRLERYGSKPLKYPVIIILDNDSGLSEFTKAVLNNFSVTMNLVTTNPFYHLVANLYVIKTPEPGGNKESAIEDLLGAAKSLPLNGKVLHLDKKTFDPAKHIDKVFFAKHVVAKNVGKVDWSGFDPLLDRVKAVIDHYKAPT